MTADSVVTPMGTAPVGHVGFSFTDMSRTTQSIPAWAIVCAILFFLFCLLGLLFLLVKEERTQGWVQIVVQGPRLLHHVRATTGRLAIKSWDSERPSQLRPRNLGQRTLISWAGCGPAPLG